MRMECTGLSPYAPSPASNTVCPSNDAMRTPSTRPSSTSMRPVHFGNPPRGRNGAPGQTTYDAGRASGAVHQLGHMRVPVDAHLRDGIARRQTRAAVEPDLHVARIVRHEEAHAVDHRMRETAHARAVLVEVVVAQHRRGQGRTASSACRISGPPMSPAWMIWSRSRHGRERLVGQLSMRVGYEADNGHDKLLLCINRSNGKYRSYAGLHATH